MERHLNTSKHRRDILQKIVKTAAEQRELFGRMSPALDERFAHRNKTLAEIFKNFKNSPVDVSPLL